MKAQVKKNQNGDIIWHAYCPICHKMLDEAPNGSFMEAAAESHTRQTGHLCFVASAYEEVSELDKKLVSDKVVDGIMADMAQKHTPGPWRIMADPDNKGKHPLHDSRFVTTADREVDFGNDPRNGNWSMARGSIICSLRDQESQLADARLIAAAPELLEACRSGLYALENCGPEIPLDPEEQDARDELWDAIAKAEGRA